MTSSDSLARDPRDRARELVARFGPRSATRLGFDLRDPDDARLGGWLLASCLLDARDSEGRRDAAAWEALRRDELIDPAAVARADPSRLANLLARAGHSRPEPAALVAWRASRSLSDAYGGSLSLLAAEAEGLEDLMGRLTRLAPGFGRASAVRLLQPLRGVWRGAQELPLDPAARAAAVHVALLTEGEDEDGAPTCLETRLGQGDCSPALFDLEAALSRLGRRSCLRERLDRCPLAGACPRRSAEPAPGRGSAPGAAEKRGRR